MTFSPMFPGFESNGQRSGQPLLVRGFLIWRGFTMITDYGKSNNNSTVRTNFVSFLRAFVVPSVLVFLLFCIFFFWAER